MGQTPARPMTAISRIIQDGIHGGTSREAMMYLLTTFPYGRVKASSDFAAPGASLAERMNAWEDMPYPQPDTIQEVMVAVQSGQLTPEELAAIRAAIEAREESEFEPDGQSL
jgi:hypothetical protein